MKLYVWTDVLRDYTKGMIVCLAPDLETALSLARDSEAHSAPEDMGRVTPEVVDLTGDVKPQMWFVYGGG